jgi:pyruvate dehydrogenase E2 component (dihydrolipoamide acetyltransferase)
VSKEIRPIHVPDIGDYKNVPVIEIMVQVGDTVTAEQSLLTLETDKATMDIPAPFAGVIKKVHVKVGDVISIGSLIMMIESSAADAAQVPASQPPQSAAPAAPQTSTQPVTGTTPAALKVIAPESLGDHFTAKSHASPAIRKFARELGVDLSRVKGSGLKGRVTKNDVQNFVKTALSQPQGGGGISVLAMPVINFAKFGEIETKPLSRIKKIAGANLHRNWVSIPHITQHDEADITELEIFRKKLNEAYAAQGIKITPLAFILKAVVTTMQQFPDFNASLDASGENLVLKKYFHIGVAVDTPDGLMVPVVRDVEQKGIAQLAKELAEMGVKARDKKIPAVDMQGGCFTISSLGGIGGTAFTPIINAPEVAILGVSKASMKPVYVDSVFVPRMILPLSLSYDHRVIDGAAAARFTTHLAQVLTDVRHFAL